VPVPEIKQYKDQIEEINEYTARIAALSGSLKMSGFYAAGVPEIGDAVEKALKTHDNRAALVPVSNFAALGGAALKDSIVWLPIESAVMLVKELVALRRIIIDDVYQITGISDIVRGQTDPNETMGAQQLKSQWGSMRIRERQNEIARFARDLTRISGELIAENFEPQTIAEMAQSSLPSIEEKMQADTAAQMAQANQAPVPKEITAILKKPTFEEIAQFLRDDKTRGFVIEIETDSTIQPDEDAEKQRRVEFVTSIGGLFQQAAPLVMQAPMLGKFAVEVIKFAAGGFRAGRQLEQSIDELGASIEDMAERSMEPQQPPPDPEAEFKQQEIMLKKEELEAKKAEAAAKLELEAKKAELDYAFKRETHGREMALKQESETTRALMQHEKSLAGDGAGAVNNALAQIEGVISQQSTLLQMAMETLQESAQKIDSAISVFAGAAGQPAPQ
jgi:hypothetical protein